MHDTMIYVCIQTKVLLKTHSRSFFFVSISMGTQESALGFLWTSHFPEKSLFLGVLSPNDKPQRQRAGSPRPRRGPPGSVLSERPLPLSVGSGLPSAWTWNSPSAKCASRTFQEQWAQRFWPREKESWLSRGWVPWRSSAAGGPGQKGGSGEGIEDSLAGRGVGVVGVGR